LGSGHTVGVKKANRRGGGGIGTRLESEAEELRVGRIVFHQKHEDWLAAGAALGIVYS
jgi:hypothetical protein